MPVRNHRAYRHGLLPESDEFHSVVLDVTYSVLLYTVLNVFCVNAIPQSFTFIDNFFRAENVGIVFIMPPETAHLPCSGAQQWDLRAGKISLVVLIIGAMILYILFQEYRYADCSSLTGNQILHDFEVVVNETPCVVKEVDADAEDTQVAGFVVVDVTSRS